MLKNAGLQGSTLSNHRMTTGFCPFELPTCIAYDRELVKMWPSGTLDQVVKTLKIKL